MSKDYIADAAGMSDLGQSAPSQSNSVGDDNPALQEFFANIKGLQSPAARASELQAKRQKLEGTEDVGFMDKISELILPALLAGGAAAGGQPLAGLGALLGGAQGVKTVASEENAAKRELLDQTIEQEEKSLQQIDKMHNRISQLVIANPDAFMDAEGEMTISPQMLGFLASGREGLSMDVSTRRKLEFRNSDKAWGKQWELSWAGLKQAKTDEEAGRWGERVMNLLHIDPDSTLHADMVSALNKPDGAEDALNTLNRSADSESLQNALFWLQENGLNSPMDDPAGWAAQLTFDDSNNSGGRITMKEAKAVEGAENIRKWMADPINGDSLQEFAELYGLGSDQYARAIAQAANSDNIPARDAYLNYLTTAKEAGMSEGQVFGANMSALNNIDPMSQLLDTYIQPILEEAGIEMDDVKRAQLENVGNQIRRAQEQGRLDEGVGYSRSAVRAKSLMGAAGLSMTSADYAELWAEAKAAEYAATGVEPGGPISAIKVSERFDNYVAVIIEQSKDQ